VRLCSSQESRLENLKVEPLIQTEIQPPKSGSELLDIQPDCKRFAARLIYKCFAVNNPDAANSPKGECLVAGYRRKI